MIYDRDEDEALDNFATMIIEQATEAGAPPEEVRLFLNDLAGCFEECRHPQRWAAHLRIRGSELVAEAAGGGK